VTGGDVIVVTLLLTLFIRYYHSVVVIPLLPIISTIPLLDFFCSMESVKHLLSTTVSPHNILSQQPWWMPWQLTCISRILQKMLGSNQWMLLSLPWPATLLEAALCLLLL
jgi:hypothetical protein